MIFLWIVIGAAILVIMALHISDVYMLSNTVRGPWINSDQAVILYGQDALDQPNNIDLGSFSWSSIEPRTQLVWHECYASFECARLQVPLDWNNRSNPNYVTLALTRLPSVVPRDDPSFAGTVLINPGGPGGSGVDTVVWTGHGIRDSIIDSADKHFEVLSWDPRGIHHTTPSLACFESDWDRQIWMYRNSAAGELDSSDNAFDIKWALYESLAKLCAESSTDQFEDGSNMHQFVSTALTTHDMIAIIDALQEEHTSLPKQGRDEQHDRHQHVLQPHEPALLYYWGFSYGTYLGNTFASMFPGRIGRMILDGNVDPYDYTRTGWFSNLLDSPKTLHWFYYDCFNAGSNCALHNSSASSLFDIEHRVNDVLKRLYHNPMAVVHDGAADLVTYADVISLIHRANYAPDFHWHELAQILHDLSQLNATSIVKYLNYLAPESSGFKRDGEESITYDNETQPYPPDYPGGLEGAISILCGDGDSIYSLTKQDWQDRISRLKNQSMIIGPIWAAIPFACQHWTSNLRPAEQNRFKGPFRSELKDYDARSSPLLFIGNTADPVTPLRNAISNSKLHEGSVVLTQDAPGHCAGPVNPSQCTFEVIRAFFANGTLPKDGKVCARDRGPWDTA